jgi:hypothetical protein
MNINEYRQGLMDLAGNGMDFQMVIRKVQEAVSAIRLAESRGKDVEWLKEFHDFAKEQIKKDMAAGRNHFEKFTGGARRGHEPPKRPGSAGIKKGERALVDMEKIPKCPECSRPLDLVDLMAMSNCGKERDELLRQGAFTLLVCGGPGETDGRDGCGWYGDENYERGKMSGLTVREQIERIRGGSDSSGCGGK